jgi:hypothetical protein
LLPSSNHASPRPNRSTVSRRENVETGDFQPAPRRGL